MQTTTDVPANATTGKPEALITWDSPAYSAADNSTINLTWYHPTLGAIPFTLSATDTGADFDTAALWAAVIASGVAIAPYVAPGP